MPDFGCYEVRLIVAAGIGSAAVIRSQPICQVKAGEAAGLDFPLPGGATNSPPVSNPPPAANQGVISGSRVPG